MKWNPARELRPHKQWLRCHWRRSCCFKERSVVLQERTESNYKRLVSFLWYFWWWIYKSPTSIAKKLKLTIKDSSLLVDIFKGFCSFYFLSSSFLSSFRVCCCLLLVRATSSNLLPPYLCLSFLVLFAHSLL